MSYRAQKIKLVDTDGKTHDIECNHDAALCTATVVKRGDKIYLCDALNSYRSAIHFLEVPSTDIQELPGSPVKGVQGPREDGKLPHPDRGRMWQFIDNALQGTVEPFLRGDICNVLAPLLVPQLRLTPCSEGMPPEGQEVLVRYAMPWPNDKNYFITGATLHQAFEDNPQLFWFNGRGEAMRGTVTHWMPAPVVTQEDL